jgi:enoyl-CoA hydratase
MYKALFMSDIIVHTNNKVSTITINRPDKLNALNLKTIMQLSEAIDEADADHNVRVVILTGSGEKAFVAGADISEFAHFNEAQGRQLASQGQYLLFDKIENCSTPVIAAINGFALGGGLELAMAAHFRVASSNARLGLPEVSLGVIPGYGGTQRLPQLVGKGRAMEMIMTAGMINADTALSYGLVNHVVTLEELIPTCLEIAGKIMRNSPVAISAAIDAVNSGFKDGVDGYEVEVECFGSSFETADFKEGTDAFLNKRQAKF